MIALDTNIIVRVVTLDDQAEVARAERLIATNEVFVGSTVVLEAAWVLRARYGMAQAAVSTAIRAFAGLPSVHLDAAAEVHRALVWADEGMDIADALHLSLAEQVGPLATFDQDLLRMARHRRAAVVEP